MPRSSAVDGDLLAAVDLGSNSFHLAVARLDHGQLRLVTTLSEKVQLAAGLDADGRLRDEVQARALACLERFAQHLQGISPRHLRIVGTNTLRVASNAKAFVTKAARVLNHPVEVIAGREEARLIYLGVAQTLASPNRRLVVDIGGGSTEFIIGDGFEALATESLHMGCVSYALRFFPGGALSARAMERAVTSARQEVTTIKASYQELGWQAVVGSSGTIKAVQLVQREAGLASGNDRITRRGLLELQRRLLRLSHVTDIELPGLKDDRKPLLPAGLAILLGVFEELGLDDMVYSDGALREGVLLDMLGRFRHEDSRDLSVQSMLARYHTDTAQARRVAGTATDLLEQVSDALALDEDDARMLHWAALLHEIGSTISHSGFHKHGAYILQHADLAGFSRPLQENLALLVGSHRRRLKSDQLSAMREAGPGLLPLCILLRLAVLLHHSRSSEPLPSLRLSGNGQRLTLRFPPGWLTSHPLTREDLDGEADTLAAIGISLTVAEY